VFIEEITEQRFWQNLASKCIGEVQEYPTVEKETWWWLCRQTYSEVVGSWEHIARYLQMTTATPGKSLQISMSIETVENLLLSNERLSARNKWM